ncbi:MAG: hypothetical protein HQ525_09340 [Anaerolineae bacterium]|nr:hypothetical protein [Anaerolineae bacterium]
MAKVNYKFQKRQKEIAKKKKRDEKLKRKEQIQPNPPTEETSTEKTTTEKP